MCLVLFAVRPTPDIPLVVAANRDEFYARPATGAHFWLDEDNSAHPSGILAGRDLEAGGTWLGISKSGRFAAVTNFAGPGADAPRSRGELPANFLAADISAQDYADRLEPDLYRGFNLLLWDGTEMVYTSNKAPTRSLPSGFYGLSNAALDATWPKCTGGRNALAALEPSGFATEDLHGILLDDTVPPDHELPNRGNDLALERRVAPRFIRGDEYGTRAATAVVLGSANTRFSERLFGPDGLPGSTTTYEFALENTP